VHGVPSQAVPDAGRYHLPTLRRDRQSLPVVAVCRSTDTGRVSYTPKWPPGWLADTTLRAQSIADQVTGQYGDASVRVRGPAISYSEDGKQSKADRRRHQIS
jgi:Tfp pilus assembly protein FimT